MNVMSRTQKLATVNLYDELIKLRDQQRERRKKSILVVPGDELPWEINPQGKMKWFLHPAIDDTAIQNLIVYLQEIPAGSFSGKLKCQGGVVVFVLEGKGHTVIDDVPFAWEAEDVVQLPIRPNGIIFQHFNDDPDRAAQLLCAEPNLAPVLGVDRGSGFEQLSEAREFKQKSYGAGGKNG